MLLEDVKDDEGLEVHIAESFSNVVSEATGTAAAKNVSNHKVAGNIETYPVTTATLFLRVNFSKVGVTPREGVRDSISAWGMVVAATSGTTLMGSLWRWEVEKAMAALFPMKLEALNLVAALRAPVEALFAANMVSGRCCWWWCWCLCCCRGIGV